jgi:hypothetical protein
VVTAVPVSDRTPPALLMAVFHALCHRCPFAYGSFDQFFLSIYSLLPMVIDRFGFFATAFCDHFLTHHQVA